MLLKNTRSLALALILSVALVACGDDDESPRTPTVPDISEESPPAPEIPAAPEEAPGEVPAPEASPSPSPAPSPSPSPSAPAPAAAVTVRIPQGSVGLGPEAFGVNPLVIAAGTTVTWVNDDSMPHTATSETGIWDSGTLRTAESFSFTFNTPGSYPYFCEIHGAQAQSGTIVVN